MNGSPENVGAAKPEDGVLADWLTRDECARQLGISPHTLKRWEQQRTSPPFAKIGSRVLYHRAKVQEWLLAKVQTPVNGGPAK